MSCYSMQQAVMVIVCSFSLFGNAVLDQQTDVKDAIYQPYVLSTDNTRKEERKPLPTDNQPLKNTVAKSVDETLATPVMPKEALTLLATPVPSNEASTPLATDVRFKEALILATPARVNPVLSNEASKPLATPVRPNEALTPMETPVRSNDLSSKNSSDNTCIIPLSKKDGPGKNGIRKGQSKCDIPKIENGNAECGNTKGNALLLCSFICNESYKLKDGSKSTASCRNGIWSPKILPSCVSSYRPVGNLSRSIPNGVSPPLVIPGRPAVVPIILAPPVRTNEPPTSLATPVRSNEMSSTNINDIVIRVPDKAGAAENEKKNMMIFFPDNQPHDTLPKPNPNNIYRSTPSPRVTNDTPVDTQIQNSSRNQDPNGVNNQLNSGPGRQPSGDLTRNLPPRLPTYNHYPPPRQDRYEDRNQRVPRPTYEPRYQEDEGPHRPRHIDNERIYTSSEKSGEHLCDYHRRRMKVHFHRHGTRRHDLNH